MVTPLPKKEMRKYSLLWKTYKDKIFTHRQAQETLKEKDRHRVTVFFYDLKRFGWMKDMVDEKDKRRRLYKLISPEDAVKGI